VVVRPDAAATPRAPVYGALVLVQVFFGLHYLASKVLLREIPPALWALMRVASAAMLLLVIVRLLGRRLPRSGKVLGRLALYSVFDASDAAVIRGRIERAYEVLSNYDTRHAYDEEAGPEGWQDGEAESRTPTVPRSTLTVESMTSLAYDSDRAVSPPTVVAELPAAVDVFEDLHAEVEEGEQEFDGAGLRRARDTHHENRNQRGHH